MPEATAPTCRDCDARIPPKPKGQRGTARIYCGRCRQNRRNSAERARRRSVKRPPHPCADCGAIIDAPHGKPGPPAVTCKPCNKARILAGNRARRSAKPRVAHPPRTCPGCNDEFTPPRRNAIYCSRRCANRVHNRRRRAERPELVRRYKRISAERQRRPCALCGDIFAPVSQRSQLTPQRFCSTACSETWLRGGGNGTQLKGKRMPLPRSVRARIFNRDGWRCQLCGGVIDPTVRWPDQRVGSIDHVVPVAAGGGDEDTNLQSAHMSCNQRKGARGSAQLRLV